MPNTNRARVIVGQDPESTLPTDSEDSLLDTERQRLVAHQQSETDKDTKTDVRLAAWRTKIHKHLQDSGTRTTLKILALILLWYILSTFLSLFNKQLFGKEGGLFGKGAFPAPLLLSGLQFGLQNLIAQCMFKLGIIERTRTQPLSWKEYGTFVVPNGVVTGLDIGFANKSLTYINLSFYTMCKSTVPVFLLLFAFLMKIEKPTWQLIGVVSIIVSGLTLLVKGEAKFNGLGFALVMTASMFSGLRFTLTQVLLQGHGLKSALGGPLEILEQLTPVMSVTAILLSIAWEQLWHVLPSSPYFSSFLHIIVTMIIILAGAFIAFFMVWTEYEVIKLTSALSFMIAGTVKEVITVLAAVVVMGDDLSLMNCAGLVVVMAGVVIYNLQRLQKLAGGDHLHHAVPSSPRGVKHKIAEDRKVVVELQAAGTASDHALEDEDTTEHVPLLASGLQPSKSVTASSPTGGGALRHFFRREAKDAIT